MTTQTFYIDISSKGNRDIIDITTDLNKILGKIENPSGIMTVFVSGSTAGITTIEYEPGLKKDLKIFLEKIIPYGEKYYHHETWNDDNGSSHIQASMIGPSITIPIVDNQLALGTWQQVIIVDCDTRPRNRKIIVQVLS